MEYVFQWSLNGAITRGSAPSRDSGLGSATCDAIELVARDHPEAEVDSIAGAYDAFTREHGRIGQDAAHLEPSRPKTRHGVARRKRLRVR